MKRYIALSLLFLLLLAGCGPHAPGLPEVTTQATTEATTEATTQATTEATTVPTLPPHSEYYIEGLDVEQVIAYYNEVVLDAEITQSSRAHLVQKWGAPIHYQVYGEFTQEDLDTIDRFVQTVSQIYGFPGMYRAEEGSAGNMDIYFCDGEELVDRMGDDFSSFYYGATTFWYDNDVINRSIICVRKDIPQQERISVILEELYNTMGPVQDTEDREDSIIYQYSNDNLDLSKEDILLLQLLYHPDIWYGMNADECAQVIRQLYY